MDERALREGGGGAVVFGPPGDVFPVSDGEDESESRVEGLGEKEAKGGVRGVVEVDF